MRLIIIRHCEPDYEHNTLTDKGWIEASSLTKRLLNEKIDYVYVSPLGRAKDTAKEYLEKTNHSYEILDWLKEFPYTLIDEEAGKERYPSDNKLSKVVFLNIFHS
jgi:probable phosphoglycerate mutase